MTATYIDSQTLGGVVVALESTDPASWSTWTTQSILTSTCVLMSVPELRISPSARPQKETLQAYVGTPGYHGIIGAELVGTIKAYTPDFSVTQKARRTVTRWARENHALIRKRYEQVLLNESYDAWMHYETTEGWLTATQIINGVLDEVFIVPVARVLGLSEAEVRAVVVRSRDPNAVAKWLSNTYSGMDKELAKRIFTVGALLRGRYQDRVAESHGTSIIHHPIRDYIVKDLPSAQTHVFGSSNSLEYLARIVVAASLSESNPEERIRTWAQNVKAVRKCVVDLREVLVPDDDLPDETALKIAVKAAQSCDIRAHPKILDKVIYHVLGLGAGAATSFLLHPWMFPVGFYASEIALGGVQDHLVPKLWDRSKTRLSQLAKSIPGRVRALGHVAHQTTSSLPLFSP